MKNIKKRRSGKSYVTLFMSLRKIVVYGIIMLLLSSMFYILYFNPSSPENLSIPPRNEKKPKSKRQKEWDMLNFHVKLQSLVFMLQHEEQDKVMLLENLSLLTQELNTTKRRETFESVMIDNFGIHSLLFLMTNESGDIRQKHLSAAILTTLLILTERLGDIIGQFPIIPKYIDLLKYEGGDLVYPVTLGIKSIVSYKRSKFKSLIFEKEKDIITLLVNILKYFHCEEYRNQVGNNQFTLNEIKVHKMAVKEVVTLIKILVSGNDLLNIYISNPEDFTTVLLKLLVDEDYEDKDWNDMIDEILWCFVYFVSTKYEDVSESQKIEKMLGTAMSIVVPPSTEVILNHENLKSEAVQQDVFVFRFYDYLVTQLYEGEHIIPVLMILGKLSNPNRYSYNTTKSVISARSIPQKEFLREEYYSNYSDLLNVLGNLIEDRDYNQLALVIIVNLSAIGNGELIGNYLFFQNFDGVEKPKKMRNNFDVFEKMLDFYTFGEKQFSLDSLIRSRYLDKARFKNMKSLCLLFFGNLLKKKENFIFFEKNNFEEVLCNTLRNDRKSSEVLRGKFGNEDENIENESIGMSLLRAIRGYVEFMGKIACKDELLGLMDMELSDDIKSEIKDIIIFLE